MISKALLLIGSPRGERSNSLQLGTYLMDRLREQGVATETAFAAKLAKSAEGRRQLLTAVDEADLLVLAFPLYVDCLPSQTIRALELIHEHRKAMPKRQLFLSIVNCGFPEPHQNQTAIDICKRFAKETGLEWAGAACISSGMTIKGKPLQESDEFLVPLIKGLDNAAKLLAKGEPLPPEAEALLYLPLVPVPTVHALIVSGENIWNRLASPKALEQMYDRPYEK
ncbi:MAG TPA: hypothetical protein VK436_00275 [Methanocella sp.]|nr:hypothetical protein [Methanocella sp.]